jgi:phosphoenolpyruvate carboxykinase (GTP)
MNALAVPQHPVTRLDALNQWVEEAARLTRPDAIHWCDGSDAENAVLIAKMQADGTLIKLNEKTHPDSWLHRSHPDDVARVEHLTFVCTTQADDAGPNNHWMAPDEGHATMDALFDGCMKGRTMYVIPYCMGPIDSPLSRCGVEITDSPYVVANMRIMTRMGAPALARIEREGLAGAAFVKGLHSIGELDPNRRFIMHFPEQLTIKSFGSGYGGNALLGKKCHALRIASYQARSEGWLAEHMLILGVENPQGETHYIAAAFPSACGKTNLAMLIPPEGYRQDGWKVTTIGDDICWMRPGADGRLYAINPEAGFFGVAPGTSKKSNPNALATIQHDTIFTNVASDCGRQPWWEGLDGGVPCLIGADVTTIALIRRVVRLRIRTPASPSAPDSARRIHRKRKMRMAFRSARSCSAAVARRWCRWCSRRATGPTACWSAPRWARKPRPPPPARSA